MTETSASLGSIALLRRYPVKSMQGEELSSTSVSSRGLLGDRAYALIDADGKVASAKNPKKWPNLFAFHARFAEPPQEGTALPAVRILLPDGTETDSGQHDVEGQLSRVIGRTVALRAAVPEQPILEEYWPDVEGLPRRDAVTEEAMPAGTFFDLATVHLLTLATLERLHELYPAGRFEVRRFRPNIVVAVAGQEKAFAENDWIGRTLLLGERVRLHITGGCPRCVMTTLPQADLVADPGILRTAVKYNGGHVGVYARVETGGTVRQGDSVRLD